MMDSIKIITSAFNDLKQYSNSTFVIHCSGEMLENDDLLKSFAEDVVSLHTSGVKIIIIHDGSNIVKSMMQKFSLRTAANVDVTDQATAEIVEMVLSGHVNKKIVSYISQAGGIASGISGKDGEFMIAKRTKIALFDQPSTDKILNFGFAGELSTINPDLLFSLEDTGMIPVISPIALGDDGRTYKIDPNDIAGAVASVLCAKKIIFISDEEGILDENNQVMYEINKNQALKLLSDNTVSNSLSSHLRSALMALEYNTESAHIINGKIPHVIMRDIFTDELVGTTVKL
jgi:acetylglutamate kinase